VGDPHHGAAFLCADLGITPERRADHASHIANWLTVLKNARRRHALTLRRL
jgi:antirestriction protein ArdC